MKPKLLTFLVIVVTIAGGMLVASWAAGLGPGFGEGDPPPLPDIALTPPVPPGATPGPYLEEPPLGPQPTSAPPPCESPVPVGGDLPPFASEADLQAYVDRQRELLETYAKRMPDMVWMAGINLKRVLNQEELEEFLSMPGLDWKNIYWESSTSLHSAISSSVGARSLAELEASLRSSGELEPDDTVTGAYYFTAFAPLSTLASVNQHADVLLVDVGALDELFALRAAGGCASRFSIPETLWYEYKRLTAGAD